MIFDKSQSVFPSTFQREVWWWAVGLVPPTDSLTTDVVDKCSQDVLNGCYQWYDYFNELCEDMYNNPAHYTPATARQYRDILEKIAADGKINGDDIVWDIVDWEKYVNKVNKSKSFIIADITLEKCLTALERIGIKQIYDNGTVIIRNIKYPKIFHAMAVMEKSPNVRKTPVRHHFAHCEFRQLFKSYSANYDELLRRVSSDSLFIAHEIHNLAKSLRIQRYIHFDTIKYKYNGIRVLDFTVTGDEYPTLRVNIGTCANPESDLINDKFYKTLMSQDADVQEIFLKNIEKCNEKKHNHQMIMLNGKSELLCPTAKIKINPFIGELHAVKCFIEARQLSIAQFSSNG